ncbi:hypothetical protein [Streptomyces sp. SLBN-31]|jgi:hypothetical protein|uniref:hypothetical protein n=1 Tax=Streptomyces sp. SLBN-31 TaxID=2768444 RepID=UPI001169D46B|nr:hypothetical protein [Streptomyces sp. SLBN-31]TQJ85342.1 hypothetical protein FBY22_4107 [Streptomyces sp. SLBN-31]
MSNQYPQQPQPGWGQQPYGQPPFPPQPPKKTGPGKIIGLGCLGIVGLIVVIGVIGALLGGGSDSKKSSGSNDVKAAASPSSSSKPADAGKSKSSEPKASPTKTKRAEKKTVVFKVWGTAPAGALGSLDITYGSDSDTRKGTFKNGKFEATLPLNKDAMYYNVMAQLQGSGDINCSVTVDGKTKKGHASGGYNICNAQLSSGLLGGWE